MQKILRKSGTDLFIDGNGSYTLDADEAIQIETASEALHFCQKHSLYGLEIVLRIQGSQHCLSLLPVGDIEYDQDLPVVPAWALPQWN